MIFIQGLGCSLLLFLYLLGCSYLGEQLLRFFQRHQETRSESSSLLSVSAATGLIALSTVTWFMAFFGLITTSMLTALTVITGTAGLVRLQILISSKRDRPTRRTLRLVVIPSLVSWLVALPVLVSPPFMRDALVYHLEVPRQYLLNQGMLDLGANVYSFFPMGIEMLYLPILAVFPAFMVRFIHFGFLLLTLTALAEYTSEWGDSSRRRIYLILVLTTFAFIPTLWLDVTAAYIDAGWMFFCLVSLLGLDRHYRVGDQRFFIPAIWASGFLLSIKYTSIYLLLIFFLIMLYMKLRHSRPFPGRPKHLALWLSAASLTALPYYIRNFLATGDPIYPFLSTVLPIHTPFWSPEQQTAFWGFLSRYGPEMGPWSWLNGLVASLNLTLHDAHWYDGVIGPFLLLAFLGLWGTREERGRHLPLMLFILGYCLIWGISIRQVRFLLPVLPAIALIAIGAGQKIRESGRSGLRRIFTAGILLLLAINISVLAPEWTAAPYWPFMGGELSRDQFLDRVLPIHPVQEYANRNLPPDARVWLLLTGNENFYLDREYLGDYIIEDFRFQKWLRNASSAEDIAKRFQAHGATYLLVREDLVISPALYTVDKAQLDLVLRFFSTQTIPLFRTNGFGLYMLPPPPEPEKYILRVLSEDPLALLENP